MSVSVASVLDRVKTTLQDTSSIRWSQTELVYWVNDAQREIALLKPDASATNETISLATGTKQSIPNAGNRLLRVVRNMSAADGHGKRSIRLVSREILDAQTPDWHDPAVTGAAAHGVEVKHYMYDEQDPRNFYVYPGVAGSAFIELIYSANPSTVTASDNLSLPDIYANSIMNYVLYQAYLKDAEYAGNSQRAGSHYQLFLQSVTSKGQIDQITTPNIETRPNLNVPTAVAAG